MDAPACRFPPLRPDRGLGGEVSLWIIGLILALLLSACAVTRTPPIYRIALLAPFEGRYREIGYNALYAARAAFDTDDDTPVWIELMPVDDGGSVTTAVLRARALTYDPQVIGAVVLGYQAADPAVQTAFGDIPVIIVGRWTHTRAADNVFILSSRDIHTPLDPVTAQIETPYEGGDVWMLEGARRLRRSFDGITVVTSGMRPDDSHIYFSGLYERLSAFAPEPNLLAQRVWDATHVLIAATYYQTRAAVTGGLRTGGIHFTDRFTFGDDGYWNEAPVNRYQYRDAEWVEVGS